ncbi:MAG: hypothetical protein QFB86_01835 [Patescibacteria group bacterium]|nr:hypothetical protein [Patescibacteria group bacterium]
MSELRSPHEMIPVDQEYIFDAHKRLNIPGMSGETLLAIERINDSYERNPVDYFQRVLDTSRLPISANGAPYMVVKENGSSTDTALAVTLPYCNPIYPNVRSAAQTREAMTSGDSNAFDSNTWNNPIKHVYLFDVMKALGVRDIEGRTVPVIAIGADSQDYKPQLSKDDKKGLMHGKLDVYRKNAEEILDAEGYGAVHVAGYSQGGSVAHSILGHSKNIDVLSGIIAEPPTYKDRSIGQLAINYLLNKPAPKNNSGVKSEEKWTESGPQVRKDLEYIKNGSARTMLESIALGGAWRTAFALRKGTMLPDLEAAAKARGIFPLTVAWGETSALTHDIEQYIQPEHGKEVNLHPTLEAFEKESALRLVRARGHEAVGAPHLAGESPLFYSLLFAQSVEWVKLH